MIRLDQLILKAQEMQPLPASVVRLAALASAPDTGLDAIADVITYDQALTLRLLRAANAAAVASTTPVTHAREALFRLGTARVLALAIASSAGAMLRGGASAYGLAEGRLWRHSLAAAAAAETLPEFAGTELPAETFSAALLHDVGKLVMSRFLGPDDLEFIRRAREEGGLNPLAAEAEVLLVHHGELGGIVAQHWELPARIVKGIIYHHQPADGQDPVCDATWLANLAAHAIESESTPVDAANVDPAPLERLDFPPEQFPAFVETARKRFETVASRYDAQAA